MQLAAVLIFNPFVVLVVALVCGFASAAIAKSKGRDQTGWFFVGFLLGVIGLIIALVVRPMPKA